MTHTCKNCNFQFEGNFCNHCGQSADTSEINFKFLWKDFSKSMLRFDPALLNTLKQLFTRPGKMVREYIAGKRVLITSPTLFVLKLALMTLVIYHIFRHQLTATSQIAENSKRIISAESVGKWIDTHYSWLVLLMIPVNAVATFIVFKKQDYNFSEHVVLNAYLTGQRLAINLVLMPLYYVFGNALPIVTVVVFLIEFSLTAWSYHRFFNKLSKAKTFLLTLLSLAITLFIVLILTVLVIVILKNLFNYKTVVS